MTIIAAKKYKKEIIICSDKQMTYGDSSKVTNRCKIFKKNNIVAGVSGDAVMGSLFEIYLENKSFKKITKLMVLELLVDFWEWTRKKDNNLSINQQFIVVANGKIFTSYGLDVSVHDDFCAIGSGMFLALGAMSHGATPYEAVKITCKYDLYCSGKIDKITLKI